MMLDQLTTFMANHWLLWLGLIFILALIIIFELKEQRKKAKSLSVSDAIEQINHHNALVFDLRPIEAFRNAHIIDALCVKMEDFDAGRMEKYRSKPFILICSNGLTSHTLAQKLRQQGYEKVMVLAGGLESWKRAELPLIKEK